MTPSPSATITAARSKRPRNAVPLAPQASKEAKRLAAVILEVLAGRPRSAVPLPSGRRRAELAREGLSGAKSAP
jgi:hypothetical protein